MGRAVGPGSLVEILHGGVWGQLGVRHRNPTTVPFLGILTGWQWEKMNQECLQTSIHPSRGCSLSIHLPRGRPLWQGGLSYSTACLTPCVSPTLAVGLRPLTLLLCARFLLVLFLGLFFSQGSHYVASKHILSWP